MATYLLLRNNKESGPLSFDEIIKLGLKPYDLIWINGKSAAWRYANEIPEFIPYAPAEKEQTITRAEQKKDEPIKVTVSDLPKQKQPDKYLADKPIISESQQEEKNGERQQIQQPIKNSKVFVSFPEKKYDEIPVTHREDQSKPAAFNSYEEKYMGLSETGKTNQHVTNPQNAQVNKSNTAASFELEEKYSQPLDEIKEMYVQTLNQRKKRNARKQVLYNGLKVAAAVSIILAIGMFIGIYFYSDTENKNLSEQIDPATPVQSELNSASFVSDSRIEPVDENLTVDENVAENVIDYSVQKDVKQENQAIAKSKVKNGNTKPIPYEGVVVDSQTNERNRVKRDDTSEISTAANNEPPVKKGSIENIWDDVKISASDFKTGPFGGIKDLQVTLANNSAYPLDKVEIEVKFIGIERQVVKTQRMVFNDVLPGGQVHADVPKTGRGMDVDVSIKKINVKDFSFASSEK